MSSDPKAGTTLRGASPPRKRGAEHVFEALAAAILNGELKPGEALPSQRELAERFRLSTLVVRQAIHRLEDLSLVRVRQGGATTVLDPNEATDVRLVELRVQLAPSGNRLAVDTLEIRVLFMLQMLVLAERRITPQQIEVLMQLMDALPAEPELEHERHFRIEYWRQIALAAHNVLIDQQMRWWRSRAGQPSNVSHSFGVFAGQSVNRTFYRALTSALEAHSGAAALYLSSIAPVLDWADAQRAKGLEKGL